MLASAYLGVEIWQLFDGSCEGKRDSQIGRREVGGELGRQGKPLSEKFIRLGGLLHVTSSALFAIALAPIGDPTGTPGRGVAYYRCL